MTSPFTRAFVVSRHLKLLLTCAGLLGALGAGCSTASDRPAGARDGGVPGYDVGPLPDAAGQIGDVPCEVADILTRYCITCHGTTPASMARTMLSAADFTTLSLTDHAQSTGANAVVRMRSTGMDHMPPLPAATVPAADIATFETWVAAGMPSGSCGITDPFDVPPQCTSGRTWTGGNSESPFMQPGAACIACHSTMRAPRLTLAGTVYPTAHEPDQCNGMSSTPTSTGVHVDVTDAAGHVFTLTPNAVGNFGTNAAVTFPITARIVSSAGVREMTTMTDSGDCNACHTQDGTTLPGGVDLAPGRILIP